MSEKLKTVPRNQQLASQLLFEMDANPNLPDAAGINIQTCLDLECNDFSVNHRSQFDHTSRKVSCNVCGHSKVAGPPLRCSHDQCMDCSKTPDQTCTFCLCLNEQTADSVRVIDAVAGAAHVCGTCSYDDSLIPLSYCNHIMCMQCLERGMVCKACIIHASSASAAEAPSRPRPQNKIPAEPCPICLDPLNDRSDSAEFLLCTHIFHTKCIGLWFERKGARICPRCNRDMDIMHMEQDKMIASKSFAVIGAHNTSSSESA